MNNKFISLLIVIILLLSVKPALTQPNSVNGFAVQHFTDENGLPQNSINDLLFDKEGYLWLATQVGLVRFNGHSFTTYYPDDKPVMESNIVSLGKNDDGTLFFQTIDHLLYRYRGNGNTIVSPVNTPAARQPFLLNAQKRLFDFSAFLQHAPSGAENRRRTGIFAYLSDHNENFFVADAGHIYFIDHDSLCYYNGSSIVVISHVQASYRFLMTGEKLFIISRDSVIGAYREGIKTLGSSRIGGDLVTAALSDRRRPSPPEYRLFSGRGADHLMAGRMLFRLTPQGDGLTAKFVVNLDFIPNISAVEYNKDLDLLLIATNTEGFYFLRKNRFLIDGWPAGLRERMASYLFGPMVILDNKAILTDKFMFTPDGAFQPVQHDGPIWQRVLYIDQQQQVWAARDSIPLPLTRNMEPAGALPAMDANIVDYGQDAGGNLYCLTEQSLWKRASATATSPASFQRLHFLDHSADRQQNEVLTVIAPHRLWIGGTNGLFEYDPDADTVRLIPELYHKHVRAIHQCADGNILVGTYGQGYYYYFQIGRAHV